MKVSKIMQKVVVADKDITLQKTSDIMEKKDIRCLVVIEKNKIIGIITEGDIARNIEYKNKKISEVMSKNVITIDDEESIDSAINLMIKNKIKKLPVVDDKGFLVGIVTSDDIIEHTDALKESFIFE